MTKVDVLTHEAPLGIKLSRDQASALYNDICRVFRTLGVDMARDREGYAAPALYALYDALYEAGVS
jgi:hypothetical protein